MSDTRSEPIYIRVRPAVRVAILRDARERGQTLTVWVERACIDRLPPGSLEEEDLQAAG